MNFFAIFWGIFMPGSGRNGIRDRFFFSSSRPIPKWSFLILWIFLLFFMEFYFLGRVGTIFRTKFFHSFLAYLDLVWIEKMPKWSFLIFEFFCHFFLEFSWPSRVGTEVGTKFFFSPPRPISTQFGLKYCRDDVFEFFFFFFFNFLSRVR